MFLSVDARIVTLITIYRSANSNPIYVKKDYCPTIYLTIVIKG
jgi:hypothetical protein